MTGKLKDLFKGRDGDWVISVSTQTDLRELFDKLNGKIVDFDIKLKRNRRSLDANAYCWVLVGEIAKAMNIPKDEVYRKAIIDSGVYTVHKVPDDMLEESIEDWKSFGIGFQTEKFYCPEDGFTNVIFYKGSHYYDSKQMAKLIDGLIQEAEGLGIPTITPKEEQKMLEHWSKGRKGNVAEEASA